MSLLEELADRLDAAGVTGGATGWVAKIGPAGDADERIVQLRRNGGRERETTVAVGRPRVQAKVRGAKRTENATAFTAAEAKLAEVVAALHGLTAVELTGTHYVAILADGDAVDSEDDQQRPELRQNFICIREG